MQDRPSDPARAVTPEIARTAASAAPDSSQSPVAPPASNTRVKTAWDHLFGWARLSGLPAKLLLLTVGFVMLAEVLIFAPSISYFRLNWLNDRLNAAYIASLATSAAPNGQMPQRLREELLASAGVRAIAVKTDNRRRMILPSTDPLVIDASFEVTPAPGETLWQTAVLKLSQMRDAFYVLVAPNDRMIRAYGTPSSIADRRTDQVEVILEEKVLARAMLRHAGNIFILSLIISMIAAALVYFALSRLLVRPMTRIATNMVAFGEAPEDRSRIIAASDRSDEVGVAERELAAMQTQLADAFAERNRLAQLGLAVSKINHDLRNMLAAAQMMSDRLSTIQDANVQRFAPKLIASLDRAIDFCNATLKFGRAAEAPPNRTVFGLEALLGEVAAGLNLPRPDIAWTTNIPDGLQTDADRDHLYRVLNNICRNAVDTLVTTDIPNAAIAVTAERVGRGTRIVISDNGPGVPPRARENLFRAFQGNARPGGTGLGLAISNELIAAHGGRLTLRDPDATSDEAGSTNTAANPEPGESKPHLAGATFEITIPDRRK